MGQIKATCMGRRMWYPDVQVSLGHNLFSSSVPLLVGICSPLPYRKAVRGQGRVMETAMYVVKDPRDYQPVKKPAKGLGVLWL